MPESPLPDRIEGILSAIRGMPEPFTVNDVAISLGKKTLEAGDLEALDSLVSSGTLTAHEVWGPDEAHHFEYRRVNESLFRDS